ncbi:hypothetical protein [Enterococcus timonensis]|uniref:hypothetical protein n=1 Tax=Enterococcus timonensis TaxID=1852364 RepID=UPI0008DA758B|nr:hypothetical protein [Enterococcus timonensis]
MTHDLYVHLDTTNNAVVTKGISHEDFYQGLFHRPKNLLLLDETTEAGQFEPHTALKMIEGPQEVAAYLAGLRIRREKNPVKWVDFSDLAMLKQLTPQEIAELLYFGHMKMHLRAPFFYKLQNNFAYFELNPEFNRVYYRYIEEFYGILGQKITTCVLEKLNEKKSFFKRPQQVSVLPEEVLKELRPFLLEGVAFRSCQAEAGDHEFKMPMYIVEDQIAKADGEYLDRLDPDAFLIYQTKLKNWRLELNRQIF